jgi:hypothetical protein
MASTIESIPCDGDHEHIRFCAASLSIFNGPLFGSISRRMVASSSMLPIGNTKRLAPQADDREPCVETWERRIEPDGWQRTARDTSYAIFCRTFEC